MYLFPFFFLLFLSNATYSQGEAIVVEGVHQDPSKTFSSHYGASLFTPADLQNYNHGDELAQKVPGLTAAGGTSRSRFFQIRGIGERSSYEGMPNESVTILIDNIDYTGVGGVLDTFGLEEIELYKGPQNTVMGPSALAGVIRAETHDSGNEIRLGGESFDGKSAGGRLSFGNDRLRATTVTLIRESDGFFKNAYLNRDDTNFKEELIHRTKLRFKNIELNVHYFELNSGYDVFNLANSKITQSEDPGRDDQRTLGLSLIHTYTLPFGKLKSIVSGHRTHSFYSYDEDWENSSSYDYRIGFDKNLQNFNLEERLFWKTSKAFHTTGLFFKNNHLSTRELGFNAESSRKDLKSTFKRRRGALFHESELPLWDSVSFFVGGRFSYLDSLYKDTNNIRVSPNETLWGGHVGLKKESHNDFYTFRLSRGFKAGGVNIGTNIDSTRREFSSESLYGLDLIWERKVQELESHFNLFATYRKDIQVKTSFQDNPSDPSSFTFYTDNATTGYSYGLEGSLSWKPISLYQLELSANVMDTAYGSYQYGRRNLKGREFAYAPNYKLNVGQTVELPSKTSLRLEHVLVDEFYFGNSHNEKAPKYIFTNLSLNQIFKTIQVKVWVTNLFQDRSEPRGFFFGNRSPSFNDEKFVQVGPPRMYGVQLDYSW